MEIFCLVVTNGTLNDYLRNVLFLAAIRLIRDRTERCKLHTSRCEGFVRTEFRAASLGSLSGIKFVGLVDSNAGRVEVSYIVRERDLPAELLDEQTHERVNAGEQLAIQRMGESELSDEDLDAFLGIPPTEVFPN